MVRQAVAVFAVMMLLTGVSGPGAFAREIYRWVDENGVVNFSSEAPPEGSEAVETVNIEDPVSSAGDADDDIYNIEATAGRTQALRDDMQERRDKLRAERLERERIAAQQPVRTQNQSVRWGYPWYGNYPILPQPPIEPQPPLRPEPYPTVPFRPPGGAAPGAGPNR